MIKDLVYPAQLNTQSFGKLQLNVHSVKDARPIEGASIRISFTGDPGNIIEEVNTNVIGQTERLELTAPPIEYSMEPSPEQPYSEYSFQVEAPGYKSVEISGAEIFPQTNAIQNIEMTPLAEEASETEPFVIPPHTLFGDYPPKIAEDEVKPLKENSESVRNRVIIPEYIIVHDGPPTDASAQNYYVRYKDYIKNVASSEIYATWSETSITANILAILSFTMNRVYTEWYRNKGHIFTVTSSTAFDHKWVPERNIFENISAIVDRVFNNYLSRPDVDQPILTQYCDGNSLQCPNWMTQWGCKYLGDQGYSTIDILRYFYGEAIYMNTADKISGVPSSFPGTVLTIGSKGDKVRQIQTQLNVVADNYPLISKIAVDGRFGEETASAVKASQKIFDLPQSGVLDFPTWHKISENYAAVCRIAELV